MRRIRAAVCQTNCRVGAVAQNISAINRHIRGALAKKADIVCFPELAVCGYPPEDLLLKPAFIQKNLDGLAAIQNAARPLAVIVGFAERANLKGGRTYNSAAVISGGKLRGVHRKNLLPNYGVFDESRYFRRGTAAKVFSVGGVKIGVNICEDIWFAGGPAVAQARAGADLIVNISASPYSVGKPAERERMLSRRARECGVPLVFCNMTGGQDELVFDGHSAFFDGAGKTLIRAPGFAERTIFADFDFAPKKNSRRLSPAAGQKNRSPENARKPAGGSDEIFSALVLGARDYAEKNGFKSAVVGLSGGIDSALTAAIAVEALGPERVFAINMPSVFSSKSGVRDAKTVAKNLGVKIFSVPIDRIVASYRKNLPAVFQERGTHSPGTALENIQARIRGNILMAFSNRFGWLVLTTGNKSEMSVGYSTLYGDMAGGFAVIKDVKKTLVYELARHYNGLRGFDAIPKSVIERPPSAELRKSQRDTDTLPPYEILDEILKRYVEADASVAETVSLSGASRRTVRKVAEMVDSSEYKRRQSPPGIKLTHKALGKDRRMPITNLYRN